MSPFSLLQVGALATWACIGLCRAVYLRRRGVRVVVPDWQRTPLQMLCDTLLTLTVLCWFYLAFAFPCGLPTTIVPLWAGDLWMDSTAARFVGSFCMLAGVIVYGLGVWAMGDAWRLGIDYNHPGPLATNGIFAYSRNPIYTAIMLLFVGTCMIEGRLIFLSLTFAFVALIHTVVKREERFLAEQYGDAYDDYCKRVGRYVTIGR